MSNLLAFLILFGVLVFVHELGHFLMAQYFKVGVEKFSLGYGPKLLGKRWGGTEYIISALPLGGYVKMVGDEPTDERRAAESAQHLPQNSFLAKPAWQRILIVLMGPIANLVLPIALFFILYMVGQPFLTATIGYVAGNSPAARADIRPGDRVLAVDQQPVQEWSELTQALEKRADDQVTLSIARGEEVLERRITPVLDDGVNAFGEVVKVGRIGVHPQSFELVLEIPDESSAAYSAGLRSGDKLLAINGIDTDYQWQLFGAIKDSGSNILRLQVARPGDSRPTIDIEMQRANLIDAGGRLHLSNAGVYLREMVVDQVLPGSIADEKGLRGGDILLALNDQPITHWFQFQEAIRANKGEDVELQLLRDGKPLRIDISPRLMEQREELTGERVRQRMLGITTRGEVAEANLGTERILNPFAALAKSAARCYEIGYLTVVGFGKLITGKVSAKSLGGPILIYQLAGKSWESGIYSFLNMLVLISITLGILNLLPIPVLDGGHLMFYTIELVKGRPIHARTREIAQQVGVFMLLLLMIFAFYNDLTRIAWDELGWLRWLRQILS